MMMARPAQAAIATGVDVAYASSAVSGPAGTSARYAHEATRSRVWPWWRWYRTGVSPQFAYRQVIETGPHWGRGGQRFEIRTRYRYVPRRVSRRVADVDVLITGIDVYRRGRFLGSIERIPPRIRRTRARIFRYRPARVDREVAVIGGGGFGYELLALRPGGGWKRPAVLAAARVNIRRGAAIPVRRSSLVYTRGARYLTPIPLLPPDIGRISTQLLRYDISYYDDSRFGSIYDGPRWDDDRDRYDDRQFEEDRRFEYDYDRRFDSNNGPVNEPRSVPRSSPGEGRKGRTPFRQEGSPSTQFAENGRTENRRTENGRPGSVRDRDSQGRDSQGRGARKSIEEVEPRLSLPRTDARTARNASPTIVSRSDRDSSARSQTQNERTTDRNGRSAGGSVSRSEEGASAMRMAQRADPSAKRSPEMAGRSASAMRRTPEAVTRRDTRTVGEGDDVVTIRRETKIVRLDDYEE